jgi:thiol-disulfide isomerase/thioredoxin
MVRVKVNKKRHLFALILTIAVFSIGILLGYSINEARVNYLQDVGKQQRLDFDSLRLQNLYVERLLEEENCEAISKTLERNINELEKTRARIESFIQDSGNNEEYKFLKREYILEQLNYWLLARETKESCNDDIVLILYFYTGEEECEDCRTQGAILTNLKEEFKEKVLIFSMDATFYDEAMVSILRESFNVKYVPTIIVGKQKFEGFTKQAILSGEICSLIDDKLEICDE